VYAIALERELIARGRKIRREALIPIYYKGDILTTQRVDMIVDERVIVELKSTSVLPALAKRQTLNYVRASTLKVALLLHFGPEPAFYRFVHSKQPGSMPREIMPSPFESMEGS
jgi:GxxExxY protein